MARRSSLPNLVVDAFEHSEATASNRNWRATRVDDYVGVEHHGTHMFNVTQEGVVEPVDRGHGSMTDRCGVRRITAGFGCGGPQGIGFRELFDDEPMNRMGSDQWRQAIQRDPELRATPNRTQGLGGSRSTEITFGPIPGAQARSTTRANAPSERQRPRGHPGYTRGHAEGYYGLDMNDEGPDYSQDDPFGFMNPTEEARQDQTITDMEETIRELDERSQRPRNEG